MSILVDSIRVSGFRGVTNLEMTLPRVAVLIGANNSGKTSLIKAMQLALGDYSRFVSEEDFHIGEDDKIAKSIIVDVRIIATDGNAKRIKVFSDEWATEFGDYIMSEPDGHQFVALRTRTTSNLVKGGYETNRTILERWPDGKSWNTDGVKETKLKRRLESLPFTSIEAQRDLHYELRDKGSFVGRILSSIEYDPDDIKKLEGMIKQASDEAVGKSEKLISLKAHLEQLSQSFQGSGSAEITPFPKKIRDISKHFSVHFGEKTGNSFPMEYHGMGTRSWASMLTVMSFINMLAKEHGKESEPFFPILAAEEPEAHLHPNAQKTLYRQLSELNGQVIISTHSPYLAAIADCTHLRGLKKCGDNAKPCKLSTSLSPEDVRRLHREVMHSRGEIFFSKAIVLCEGETEEQALPQLFEKYFGAEPFTLGVNFVGVGGSGKRYLPFFTFSKDFDIPIFIFTDGEPGIVKDLKKHYESVFGAVDIATCTNITVLENTDFERYLLSSGFSYIIEDAIKELDGATAIDNWISKKDRTSSGSEKTSDPPCTQCKQPIYSKVLRDFHSTGGRERAIIDIVDSSKPKYAPAIAAQLCGLDISSLPPKLVEFFEKIKAGVPL